MTTPTPTPTRTRTRTKGSVPFVLTDQSSMRRWSRTVRHLQGLTLALVPTMGYLHQGHISLIEEARNHADAIVVSIYVNPGQFSPSEDLSTYPRDFLSDLEKLQALNCVDAVFRPRDLYDYSDAGGRNGGRDEGEGHARSCVEEKEGGHETWLRVERLEKGLCGMSRPVFFRGVATVVCKLFNVIEPDVAVFGKKDYQQWRIIQRMVRDLDFGIRIIGSEIVRDDDGLAMSSRNVNLSPEERQKALSISRSLSMAKHAAENGERDCRNLKDSVIRAIEESGGRIDYAEIVKQDTLEAATEIQSPVVFCVAACFGKGGKVLADKTELKTSWDQGHDDKFSKPEAFGQ